MLVRSLVNCLLYRKANIGIGYSILQKTIPFISSRNPSWDRWAKESRTRHLHSIGSSTRPPHRAMCTRRRQRTCWTASWMDTMLQCSLMAPQVVEKLTLSRTSPRFGMLAGSDLRLGELSNSPESSSSQCRNSSRRYRKSKRQSKLRSLFLIWRSTMKRFAIY